MRTIHIHFHSNADKNMFVKKNAFTSKEIIDETESSITIKDDGYDYTKNVNVYSVEQINN